MKKQIKYSEKDMAALISEVEAQFSTRVAKAAAEKTDLKKSEAVAQPVEEKQPVVEVVPQEQTFDYDESDIAEMNAMYGSMTKAEATAHYESLKKALSKEDDNKPAVKAEETTISKSEVKEPTATKTEDETVVLKSEIESLKSEKEKLEKSFQDLTAKLTEFFKGSKAPKQKAITKMEYVAKSEDEQKTDIKATEDVSKLDKSEVSKRLTAKIRSGKLEKAEREKINEFYQSGSKNIESIRHLLTGGN
jgi:hypothetical protein